MKQFLAPAFFLLSSACLSVENNDTGTILDFDFNIVGDGFVAGAADFPVAQAGAVDAFGDVRLLPASLTSTVRGLYLKGTGVSGDLFLFQKRRFTGLPPSQTYEATISVQYITDYHSGCNGGAGPLTVVKAGVRADEPIVTDAQGTYRMNFDKGTGLARGDYTQLGDIRNGLALCPTPPEHSVRSTVSQTQTAPLVTDIEGGFWVWVGTQSSFTGAQEIYFTRMRLTLRIQ